MTAINTDIHADPVVAVERLTMTYRAPVRAAGLRAAFRALLRPEYRHVEAVVDLSFLVRAGEVVGFLGPNGAGKTTTMKILSGVLHPTGGRARVLGFEPARRRHEFLKQIALVRGSQPIVGPVELTVMDSFNYRRILYEIPREKFRNNLAELENMLDLTPLLTRQVRALSLGERTRAGLALALVHRPRVLFLDEPSIGLDVTAAAALREFIAEYATRTHAAVLLTSHYMAEIESLCSRVVLIDHGRLRYDGRLTALTSRLSQHKLITVTVDAPEMNVCWSKYGSVEACDSSDPARISLRVSRDDAPRVTARLLAELPVADLAVEEPPLESVMQDFYRAAPC